MKRFYSITLLISLLVGTLQPILPMIEYQLHGGDIIELLGLGDADTETDCPMSICMMENCEPQQAQTDQSLLDLDYYPLALEIIAIPKPQIFWDSTRYYLPVADGVISPTFLPNPPPPRVS